MPKYLAELILSIDPTANVEKVGDIADANGFRIFGNVTRAQWAQCIEAAK